MLCRRSPALCSLAAWGSRVQPTHSVAHLLQRRSRFTGSDDAPYDGELEGMRRLQPSLRLAVPCRCFRLGAFHPMEPARQPIWAVAKHTTKPLTRHSGNSPPPRFESFRFRGPICMRRLAPQPRVRRWRRLHRAGAEVIRLRVPLRHHARGSSGYATLAMSPNVRRAIKT